MMENPPEYWLMSSDLSPSCSVWPDNKESRILNYQVFPSSKLFPEKWLFWREVKPFSLVSLSVDSTELRIASKASRWRLFGSLNTKQQYALLLYLLQLMLALQLFEGEAKTYFESQRCFVPPFAVSQFCCCWEYCERNKCQRNGALPCNLPMDALNMTTRAVATDQRHQGFLWVVVVDRRDWRKFWLTMICLLSKYCHCIDK